MYKLFKIRENSLTLFKEKLTQFIVESTTRIVEQNDKEIDRISLLIELRGQIFDFQHRSFEDDVIMLNTVIIAFDKAIDCNP